MSYTHPLGQPQGAARTPSNLLRESLIAELIAINGYQEHIADSDMPDVNAAWQSIMEDEKKHYGMFLTLLRKYDPAEYAACLQHRQVKPTPRSPMQLYRPAYDRQIILNNIREDIKGELEAVILYEHQVQLISQRDIRQTLQSIADEEKGHTEHLTRVLLKYDADKYDGLE